MLVSVSRLDDTSRLRLDVVTRSGVHTLEGAAHFLDSVAAPGATLHFYRFETAEQRRTPWRSRP